MKSLRRPLPWNGKSPDPATIADDRLRQAAESFFELRAKLEILSSGRDANNNAADEEAAMNRAELVSSLEEISRVSKICDLVSASIAPAMEINRASSAGNADKAVLEKSKVDETADKSLGDQKNVSAPVPAAKASSPSCAKDMRRDILNHVEDWDKTVTHPICTELRLVTSLQNTREKYEEKVNSLKESDGKMNGSKTSFRMTRSDKKGEELASKIARNETKLRQAAEEYRKKLINVTLLVEEATQRGWRDLIPLVNKIIKSDVEAARVHSPLQGPVLGVWEDIEVAASKFHMSVEDMTNGRLKHLNQEDSTNLVRAKDMEEIDTIELMTIIEYGVPKLRSLSSEGSSSSNDDDTSGVFRSSDNGSPSTQIPALERKDELRLSTDPSKDEIEQSDTKELNVGEEGDLKSLFLACNWDSSVGDNELTALTPIDPKESSS